MERADFAKLIKTKYPQYQSVDDDVLVDKITEKYPVYQSYLNQVNKEQPKSEQPNSQQSIFEKVGNAINKGYEIFSNLPVIKQAGQLIGGTTAVLGGAIGGTEGAILESARQTRSALAGEGFDLGKVKESSVKLAKDVGGFGYDIGKSSVPAALTGGAGKVANAALAYGQGYQGYKDIKEGIKTGDVATLTQGGVELGTALLGAKNVKDVNGWVLDKNTIPAIKEVANVARNKFGGKINSALETRLIGMATDLSKMTPKQTNREVKWGKNSPKFFVEEGILPEIKSNGNRLDTTQATTMTREKYQAENNAFNEILKDTGQYFSLDKFREEQLNQIIGDSKLKAKGTNYQDSIDYVNAQINALKENFQKEGIKSGNDLLVPADIFNTIKSALWEKSAVDRKTPGADLTADINYQLGHTAKDIISSTIDDADINKMNERLGDFAQAIKVLENANGKVVPGGMLGQGLTRLAGTIAGATEGLPGAIIGNLTGAKLAEIAANPQIRTSTLSKIYAYLNKDKNGYKIIEEADKILKNRQDIRSRRKLLEAPKTINLGGKSDTSRLFTQEEAQALLDSLKIKEPPKLLKAPLGDRTNPIILPAPKK